MEVKEDKIGTKMIKTMMKNRSMGNKVLRTIKIKRMVPREKKTNNNNNRSRKQFKKRKKRRFN